MTMCRAFQSGLQGQAPPVRHDLVITKAMSVRLRAPEGGFAIEFGIARNAMDRTVADAAVERLRLLAVFGHAAAAG